MRLLHTSDWHLGRAFHGVGLLDVQAAYLDHLVDVVRAERVDVVVVAGDVYDRAVPAPGTVELLSEGLTRLVEAGAQVVVSSGNHDSAIRLGFAAPLLARAGLHVRTSVAQIGQPVVIDSVAIHPIPYLEPSQCAGQLGALEATHAGVLGAAMDRVRADTEVRGLPTVVMAHAFVTGAATSDSERDISAGGVSAVHPRVFSGASYAALGHIHRPQLLGEGMAYSGSPIAYSFSEAGHVKSSRLVDLDEAGAVQATEVPVPVGRALAVIEGSLDDLLTDRQWAPAEAAFVRAVLTDPIPPLAAMERLRRRFPHTVDLAFAPSGAIPIERTYAARVAERTVVDVCCDFLEHVREGRPASDPERAVLDAAVELARVGRQEADDRVPVAERRAGVA